jgi:hypothetical protein
MADEIERANAYNTAVGGVGYAGILTIFSLTHDMLDREARAVVALLLVISIAFYVGWVVATMAARTLEARGDGDAFRRMMMKGWLFVLGITIASAIGAAGIMAWYYVAQIVS